MGGVADLALLQQRVVVESRSESGHGGEGVLGDGRVFLKVGCKGAGGGAHLFGRGQSLALDAAHHLHSRQGPLVCLEGNKNHRSDT